MAGGGRSAPANSTPKGRGGSRKNTALPHGGGRVEVGGFPRVDCRGRMCVGLWVDICALHGGIVGGGGRTVCARCGRHGVPYGSPFRYGRTVVPCRVTRSVTRVAGSDKKKGSPTP